MIPSDRIRDSRQWLAGVALGLYAALVALAPGLGAKALLCAPLVAIPLVWFILQTPNRWLILFFFSALLAPPLPIALGDSGPHVALLFAAAGLWVGLLRLPEWRFRVDLLGTALLTLLLIFFASTGMAAIYSGGNVAAASLARVVLFGISVYTFLYVRDGPGALQQRQSLRAIRWLFWAAAASALFACVDFYFQFPAPSGYAQQFIWLESGVFRRAQGVFYEASTLGNLCAFFLEMIAVALFRPREDQPVPRLAMLVGGVALAGALVVSYSRASLLNLAVALIVLVWLHRDRIRWRRLVAGTAIFGASAAALLSFAFPIFAGHYWQRVAVALQYFWEAPNQVLSGRVESWLTLWNFIAAEPWHLLLGIGYKTLPYSDFIGSTAIGDNTYISLLVETGILGLAAVVALNIAILFTARRASRSTDPVRSFCGTWMFCFWAGQVVQMFSADLLTYWRVLPVYLFVLALAGSGGSGLGLGAGGMDVLFLDQFSELWGAQKCLLDLLPALEERGWRASVALPGNGPLVKLLHARNVQIHSIPCGPYRSGNKSISDGVRFTRDLREQVKILQPLEFDLLYVNGPRILAAAAMAFGNRRPALFHAHSRIPAGPQSWLADWSLRRLNATVAACAQAVAPRILSGKLKLIPNGTEDMGHPASGADPLVRGRRLRRPAGEIYGLPNSGSRGTLADQGVRPTEDWRIGMIGAIRPEKGQLDFLGAAALLAPNRKDLRFVLCGAPGDPSAQYFRTIQKYLDSLPLDLLGWRDDIATVLSELDLLVIASESEGMPRVMLEAFSAGVPVVAYPVGGIPEVIRDGENGFLVREKTPESLATRLREVIQGPLGMIANNARREWEQKYTVEIYRKNITALMESLVSSRPSAREKESRQSRR